MKLKNRSGQRIVIEPGEDLDVSRFMTWIGGDDNTLKILSIDKLKEGYQAPEMPGYGEGGYGTTVATDGAGESKVDEMLERATKIARRKRGVEKIDGEYVCPASGCDYTSEYEKGVKVHHTKIHGFSLDPPKPQPEEWSECPECGDEFGTKTGMKRHYAMVHDSRYDDDYGEEKPFECPECGEKCRTEHGVKVHYGRVHEGSIAETAD